MRIAILTVSDTCAHGLKADLSGALLKELAIKEKAVEIEEGLVPDERILIESALVDLALRNDVIITTGGTGLAPRDVTPEATLAVIDKRCGGLETALHMNGLQKTPMAALSRLVAGIRGRTLIVNLPGSRNAVKDGWSVLAPLLEHSVALLTGTDVGHLHNQMNSSASSVEDPN